MSMPHADQIRPYAKMALGVAVVFLGIAVFGLFQAYANADPRPLFSWLIGFAFWFSIATGMLFLVMLWYLFGAGWPIIVRRQLEHGLAAFKWLGVGFLPLLGFVWFYHQDPGIVWSWLNPDKVLPGGYTVSGDVLYLGKAAYLNKDFFTLRVLLFFGLWIGLAAIFRKCSFKMDSDADIKWNRIAVTCAAAGVPLVALAVTFAAIDWFKSIEFHWFSTMYGVWFFASSMRTGLAATILICLFLSKKGYLKGIFNRAHQYELACLCLAFTVFWAYISFSQYFLIYHANIPEETFWYSIREINPLTNEPNSWFYVSVIGLIFGHFFAPFLLLLWYNNKVKPKRIAFICCWILVFQCLDFYFNILPVRIPADNVMGYVIREMSVTLFDVAALVGMGGLCLWAFFSSAMKAAPIPIRDPRIQHSLSHHE